MIGGPDLSSILRTQDKRGVWRPREAAIRMEGHDLAMIFKLDSEARRSHRPCLCYAGAALRRSWLPGCRAVERVSAGGIVRASGSGWKSVCKSRDGRARRSFIEG